MTVPVNAGKSVSTTDARQSTPNNNIFRADRDLTSDPKQYSYKALTEYIKTSANVDEKYEIAIIVTSTVSKYPKTARNTFIKNNFPSNVFPTEYKILRAPLELEDINLTSDIDDLSKWCSMEFASISSTLAGKELAPGTPVIVMKDTNDGEFHIIDVLAAGGFVANSPKTVSNGPFKFRTCIPPPVGGTGNSVNIPQGTYFCPDVVKALIDKQPFVFSESDKKELDRLSPGFKQKLVKFLPAAYEKGYFPAAWENQSNPLAAENFRSYINSGSRTIQQQREANPYMENPENSLHTKGLAVDLHFRKLSSDGSIRKLTNFEDELDWNQQDDESWKELAILADQFGISSGHYNPKKKSLGFRFKNIRGNKVRDSLHFQSSTDRAIEIK